MMCRVIYPAMRQVPWAFGLLAGLLIGWTPWEPGWWGAVIFVGSVTFVAQIAVSYFP